jgi:hypothetical protein
VTPGREGTLDGAARRQIEKIIGGMECPKHFQCAQSGFESLCQADDRGKGEGEGLRCLEDDPSRCIFAFIYRGTYHCDCPLRLFLYRKLEI